MFCMDACSVLVFVDTHLWVVLVDHVVSIIYSRSREQAGGQAFLAVYELYCVLISGDVTGVFGVVGTGE